MKVGSSIIFVTAFQAVKESNALVFLPEHKYVLKEAAAKHVSK